MTIRQDSHFYLECIQQGIETSTTIKLSEAGSNEFSKKITGD